MDDETHNLGSGSDEASTVARRATVRHVLPVAIPVILVVMVVLAFLPALQGGFLAWDDRPMLILHDQYHPINAQSLSWMVSTSYGGHFQPLTWLSWAVDRAIWGLDPFGFRLTNVLWHVVSALLFYAIARRLLTIGFRDNPVMGDLRISVSAGLAALLFAIHPLRVESVAWITERRDVLGGCLFLASVMAYLRYAAPDRLSTASQSNGRFWYIASIIACALSLTAKATAMTMAPVLFILDVYPLGRISKKKPGELRAALVDKVPFLILGTVAAWRALVAQRAGGALYALETHDWAARFAQACYGLNHYIIKTAVPFDLAPLYRIPPREVLLGSILPWSLAGCAVGLAVAILMRRKWPALVAALACYVVLLLPVLGFAQSGPQLVADRYSYLSCMGLALAAVAWAAPAFFALRARGRRTATALIGLAVAVSVTSLEKATFAQCDHWRSSLRLWRHAVEVDPKSSVAYTNLADAVVETGMLQQAAGLYLRALELDESDAVAHHHLADVYARSGRTSLAIASYIRSLRIDPARRNACLSLSSLLVDVGRGPLAVTVLQDGLKRHPRDTEILASLVELLAGHPDSRVRNASSAISHARHLLALRGQSDLTALMLLGDALAAGGAFDEAVEQIESAMAVARETNLPLLELQHRLMRYKDRKPLFMSTGSDATEPG